MSEWREAGKGRLRTARRGRGGERVQVPLLPGGWGPNGLGLGRAGSPWAVTPRGVRGSRRCPPFTRLALLAEAGRDAFCRSVLAREPSSALPCPPCHGRCRRRHSPDRRASASVLAGATEAGRR